MALVACAADTPSSAPAAPPDHWTRVTLGHPFNEPEGHVDTISRVDVDHTGLWLALGSQSERPGAAQKPAAWASSDDKNWRSIAIPVGADEVGSVSSAASAGPLGLVGGEIGSGGDAVPAVWTSSTGWTWNDAIRLPLPSDRRGVVVHSVTHGPGGWVAVGGAVEGGASGPLFWYSTDGNRWSLGDAGSFPAGVSAWSVASSGDRYVAVVSTVDPERSRQEAVAGSPTVPAVVLASSDGHAWQPQTLTGCAGGRGFGVAGARLVRGAGRLLWTGRSAPAGRLA
jgi:hypothetical protein